MDFSKTDEQELLLESLQEWLDRNITENDVQKWYYEDHGVPQEITKSFYDAGFATLGLPEEYGGTPCDFQTLAMCQETISRHVCCNMLLMGCSIQLWDILTFGNEKQKKWCSEFYANTGTLPFAMALSEPDAGSDSANIQAAVTEKDGKLVLNGHKTWVSSADKAEWFMVTAKEEGDDARKVTMWFVPADTPGITIEPIQEIGFNLMPFCEVYFDDVEVDPENVLGQRGMGWIQLMKNFEVERALVGASILGAAQGAQDDAGAYVNERICFKKPISQFQLIQEKLTDNEIALTNMRNLLYYTMWKLDHGEDTRIETSMLKRYAGIEGTRVADNCMQIFGGLGYTRDTRVSRAWIDNRGYQIGGGTIEIMVHIAGRQLAKKYARK